MTRQFCLFWCCGVEVSKRYCVKRLSSHFFMKKSIKIKKQKQKHPKTTNRCTVGRFWSLKSNKKQNPSVCQLTEPVWRRCTCQGWALPARGSILPTSRGKPGCTAPAPRLSWTTARDLNDLQSREALLLLSLPALCTDSRGKWWRHAHKAQLACWHLVSRLPHPPSACLLSQCQLQEYQKGQSFDSPPHPPVKRKLP